MFVVKHFSILDRPLRENPNDAPLNTCSDETITTAAWELGALNTLRMRLFVSV